MNTAPQDELSQGSIRRNTHPQRIDALDGLRTIAVLLVLCFHVKLPGLDGGFLGVDIFFVLSGFLITSLLVREITERGRADLATFWMRRVLRLLPASLLVISMVMTWAAIWAPPEKRAALGSDALWSLLYVANWRFIDTAGYYAEDGTFSPLRHVWSLAVEEQFYVVWPLLLVLLTVPLLGRLNGGTDDAAEDPASLRRQRRRAVAQVALPVALAFTGVSIGLLWVLYDPTSVERAYMGTDAKAFEPLIGAATALLVLRTRAREWISRHSQVLIWLGLLNIVAGVLVLHEEGGPRGAYFHGGAAIFALGCAVLVAATALADRQRGIALLLGSAPLAYLGRISYGIYLWHWPICLVLAAEQAFNPIRALAVLGLTILVASASYHLVEYPIRTGRLRKARPHRVLIPAGCIVGAAVVTSLLLGGSLV